MKTFTPRHAAKNFTAILIAILSAIFCSPVHAQNIGVGTTSPLALLDITAPDPTNPTFYDGILIPRVNKFPFDALAPNQKGMLLFLTIADGTRQPGFYFWDAPGWKYIGEGKFWNLTGNAGSNPATHFFGTTDNQDLIFKRNSIRAGLIGLTNTSWGTDAFNPVSTGTDNTATGRNSLSANTSGSKNTATGQGALFTNTTGGDNTANGYNALGSNKSGSSNVANGTNALYSNTDGGLNTANGFGALAANTHGANNTAIGHSALTLNSTGSNNVALGYSAGFNETGSNKLYISNSAANSDAALIYGDFSSNKLRVNYMLGIGLAPVSFPLEIKGIENDLIKFYDNTGTAKWHMNLSSAGILGFTETDVAENRLVLRPGGEVGIGKLPLNTNNDSRLQIKQKGSQHGLGIEAALNSNRWDFDVTVASDMQLFFNGTFKGTFSPINGAYVASSDRRLKKDITPQSAVINNLMQLQAYQYHYLDNKPTANFTNGFMAQDVQKIFPDAVFENEMKNGEKRLGISYQYFTVLAVKGLQEQQKIIESQEERITKLEKALAVIIAKQ